MSIIIDIFSSLYIRYVETSFFDYRKTLVLPFFTLCKYEIKTTPAHKNSQNFKFKIEKVRKIK